MKDGFVKVAAVVPELRVADCSFNAQKTVEAAHEAIHCLRRRSGRLPALQEKQQNSIRLYS